MGDKGGKKDKAKSQKQKKKNAVLRMQEKEEKIDCSKLKNINTLRSPV